MGLNIVKYGEDAVVDLTSFTLDTPRLRALRKSERAVARKGATLHIVDGADHSFHVLKRSGRTDAAVLDELADAFVDWAARA